MMYELIKEKLWEHGEMKQEKFVNSIIEIEIEKSIIEGLDKSL